MSRAMGMLRYAKKYLPPEIVKTCIPVQLNRISETAARCGVCGETLLDKLQKLQNRAARIVTNSSCDASSLSLIGN